MTVPIRWTPPWLNGTREGRSPSALTALSWPILPSVTTAVSRGMAAIVAARKPRQVAISSVVGLFSGGTQRTALVMRVSMSVRPSSGLSS